jgi:hypothetical protein
MIQDLDAKHTFFPLKTSGREELPMTRITSI